MAATKKTGEFAHLASQLASVPHRPGVYIYRDAAGRVLYVGKAKDLAKRVGSYFAKPRALAPAKQIMVRRIADIETVVAESESEALLLEASLIRRHQPPFNVVMRDDRSFVFVQVDRDPPQVRVTRYPQRGRGRRVFGPYASADTVYQTLRALKSALVGTAYLPGLFVVPRRGQLLPPVGSSEAPTAFTGHDRELATAAAAEVEQFLAGRTRRVVGQLERQLRAAAAGRRYEAAASLRDQLVAIRRVLEHQQAVSPRPVNWDVASLYREGSRSAVNLFRVRGGKIVDRVATALEHSPDLPDEQVLAGFLDQLYQATDDRPAETVTGPSRGLRGELWRLGLQNAEHHLRADALRHQPAWEGAAAARQLALALGLGGPLRRIELVDISHLQGTAAVASLVAATDGAADSSQYRRFRIRWARGGDDYASIREVVGRRAAHSGWPRPDLLAIDGGAGQLSAAREALAGTPLADVPTVAIAKREELIYTDPRTPPLRLPRRSAALQLVQRLRDEAHRFAITYNRNLRSRAIPGNRVSRIKKKEQRT